MFQKWRVSSTGCWDLQLNPWNSRALLGAFTIGALLLGLVLLVPALEPLFAVAPLSIGMVGAIVGLAFGSMLVIQLLKWIRR